MIGRATLGNPWIFKTIIEGIEETKNGQPLLGQPSNKERLEIILEHLDLMIQEKGEYVAIREMRKHISGYTKNLPNSSKFREEMNKIEDKDKLVSYITEYITNIDKE
jgi:tRNA-dihydrouridine synthase B